MDVLSTTDLMQQLLASHTRCQNHAPDERDMLIKTMCEIAELAAREACGTLCNGKSIIFWLLDLYQAGSRADTPK
jgi:hypothetical protein